MKVFTFGEVMLRLKTPEHLKILQADTFEANYGGAEANVAVSLATLGDDVSYVTKVPEHQVDRQPSMRSAGSASIHPVCCGAADASVFTILKRERISARRAWFMTALTAQLQWQRQRNLTGKNCLMA